MIPIATELSREISVLSEVADRSGLVFPNLGQGLTFGAIHNSTQYSQFLFQYFACYSLIPSARAQAPVYAKAPGGTPVKIAALEIVHGGNPFMPETTVSLS